MLPTLVFPVDGDIQLLPVAGADVVVISSSSSHEQVIVHISDIAAQDDSIKIQ